MKFLCLECDAQMKSVESERQKGDGTLSVVLECPECFSQFGLLTNPMETRMLDALDVSVCPVGGKGRVEAAAATAGDAPAGSAKCPFPGVASGMQEVTVEWAPEALARLEHVPSFARSMVKRSIE